ncbi:MAG: hypothetical protein QM831_03485 [Kofleriaceae bacterium]
MIAILLGLLVGLRHAFEPDHLTAISTLVGETHDAKRGALLGAIWGLGHTVSLVVVGSILLAVGATLPEHVAAAFECCVAAMLVLLGVRAIMRRHDPVHPHVHVGARTVRPLVVGLVHGLAGSGALTAIVFAQLPTMAERIAYIALFGVGSIGGMAIASGLAGATLQVVVKGPRVRTGLSVVTGVVSIVVGIVWAIPMVALL